MLVYLFFGVANHRKNTVDQSHQGVAAEQATRKHILSMDQMLDVCRTAKGRKGYSAKCLEDVWNWTEFFKGRFNPMPSKILLDGKRCSPVQDPLVFHFTKQGIHFKQTLKDNHEWSAFYALLKSSTALPYPLTIPQMCWKTLSNACMKGLKKAIKSARNLRPGEDLSWLHQC
jgi:hypothetical protein